MQVHPMLARLSQAWLVGKWSYLCTTAGTAARWTRQLVGLLLAKTRRVAQPVGRQGWYAVPNDLEKHKYPSNTTHISAWTFTEQQTWHTWYPVLTSQVILHQMLRETAKTPTQHTTTW
ncbi:hypothetical protein BKA58DRAFT_377099 [Alternaria rosae]|uniref:uncharacterized protein n=1 Tax=Alternaria rosae TaxID=1187941 RepID=UPI001E8D802D|nr:uncharacterized protein BKA58DRAFT_377099 [Alternaria rosae]KAH6878376.1 hypothetical protein BKA58DRAFT_377099 [Alternaria rosae]